MMTTQEELERNARFRAGAVQPMIDELKSINHLLFEISLTLKQIRDNGVSHYSNEVTRYGQIRS
jgi:hypothetical protein